MNIRLKTPNGASMHIFNSNGSFDETHEMPAITKMKPGSYRAVLTVPASYAKNKLHLPAEEFQLFGMLDVGKATENASFANVTLLIPDALLVSARRDGKVIEAYTFDEEARGATLLSIKLGEAAPW